jgi:chromosome partitioning protein
MGGLNEALKDIADVRRRRNPTLEVLGVVLTCVDTRTNLAVELEEVIARELPGRAFKAIITQAIALPDCSGKGKTLFQMKQYENHKVTEQYRILTHEIERRLLNREAFLTGQLSADQEMADEAISRREETEPAAVNS